MEIPVSEQAGGAQTQGNAVIFSLNPPLQEWTIGQESNAGRVVRTRDDLRRPP
jgi:hypothetical protein